MVQKFLAASVQPSAIGLFVSKKSKVERTGTSGLEGNFKLQNFTRGAAELSEAKP
jgi:hypothetical protein